MIETEQDAIWPLSAAFFLPKIQETEMTETTDLAVLEIKPEQAPAKREADLQAAKEKAEADAKAAQERAEREAREAQERAEKHAREAREQAEREKQAAIEAEQRKAREAEAARLAEEKRIADEAAARAADVAHRKAVNNKALADLVAVGLTEEQARTVITAIAKGEVTAIRITY